MIERIRTPLIVLALAAPLVAVLTGCATLREVTALSRVDFALRGVTGGTLAGIPIESVRNTNELSTTSMARLGLALSRGELPFEAVFEIEAANPPENAQARLVGLEWTLFLDDRETVSGSLDRERLLPPGETTVVPLDVELDLLDFFDRQLDQVVGLALAVAGAGEPQRVRLEATPTIQTPIGPIRYPEPVRIEYEAGA